MIVALENKDLDLEMVKVKAAMTELKDLFT